VRITEYLAIDHARLRALLAKAASAADVDQEAYAALRRGLLRHIAIEEKLLLPAARDARGGAPLERAHDMRVEHAALTSLLVPTPDRALVREIAALLAAHEQTEDGPDGVFAECERLISEGRSTHLALRARELPPVRLAPHYDGPGTHRTADDAVAGARRIKPPSARRALRA
jgi:hypothetical protein